MFRSTWLRNNATRVGVTVQQAGTTCTVISLLVEREENKETSAELHAAAVLQCCSAAVLCIPPLAAHMVTSRL